MKIKYFIRGHHFWGFLLWWGDITHLDDASKLLGGKRKSESDRDPNPTTVEGNPKDRNEECTLPEGRVTENPIVVTAADRNRSERTDFEVLLYWMMGGEGSAPGALREASRVSNSGEPRGFVVGEQGPSGEEGGEGGGGGGERSRLKSDGEEETEEGRGQKNRWERPKEKGKRGEQGTEKKKKRKKGKREPHPPPTVHQETRGGGPSYYARAVLCQEMLCQAGRLCLLLLLLLTGKAKQSNLSQYTTTNPSHPTHHPPGLSSSQPTSSTAQLPARSFLRIPGSPPPSCLRCPLQRESKVRPFGPLCCCSSFSFFFFVHFVAALHPLLALHDTCVLTFLLSTVLILTNPNIEPKKIKKSQPKSNTTSTPAL